MSTRLEDVQEDALRLTPEERVLLVESILASMESELHPDWRDELESRVAEWQRGETQPVNGAVVFAQARRIGT